MDKDKKKIKKILHDVIRVVPLVMTLYRAIKEIIERIANK